MFPRLKKLGIEETENPDNLTKEERIKFCRLNIDRDTITWNRVIDTNDRYLREITIGEGPEEKGKSRKAKFDITVASELMAILALTNSLKEMKEQIGRITVCQNLEGEAITADDLGNYFNL
jgi:formyltetrahydrofolate synthetase